MSNLCEQVVGFVIQKMSAFVGFSEKELSNLCVLVLDFAKSSC